MGSGKEGEDKEPTGLKGLAKRLFGLGGSSGCCDGVKIVQLEEDEEKTETIKEAD